MHAHQSTLAAFFLEDILRLTPPAGPSRCAKTPRFFISLNASKGQPLTAFDTRTTRYAAAACLCLHFVVLVACNVHCCRMRNACSVRGEWLWSYPDPDEQEGEGGKGEGGGEGSGAEDSSFALSLHDEVRFRVRTLEFTQA